MRSHEHNARAHSVVLDVAQRRREAEPRAQRAFVEGAVALPPYGESMRLSVREVQEKDGAMRQVREWICPECDYFEEADGEG